MSFRFCVQKAMKKNVFLYLLLWSLCAYSQDYANAWIDYTNKNKKYVKIQVVEEGIYRVNYNQVSIIGNPNIQNIQLFYQGKEQHIRVVDANGNNIFDNPDYIEFYGNHNNGLDDRYLYNPALHPQFQKSYRHSLFTDSASYILTYSTTAIGKRYTDVNITSAAPALNDYWHTSYVEPINYYVYHTGSTDGTFYDDLSSDYTLGEGWFGPEYGYNGSASFYIPTKHIVTSELNPAKLTVKIYFASDYKHGSPIDHATDILIGSTVVCPPQTGNGYSYRYFYNNTLSHSLLTEGTTVVTARERSDLLSPDVDTDNNALCWASIRYKRTFEIDNHTVWYANIQGTALGNRSITFITAYPINAAQACYWDTLHKRRILGSVIGNQFTAVFPATPTDSTAGVWINEVKTPARISECTFAYLYEDGSQNYDYIIFTSRDLAVSAENYKNYRQSIMGGSYKVKIYYVDELYNEFAYGHYTPLALKRAGKVMSKVWTNPPKYLLLWGKAVTNARDPKYDRVPTYGYPASDIDFVANFDYSMLSGNFNYTISVGRMCVLNDTEGNNYLQKVITHESLTFQLWMKEVLHLGGGGNLGEQTAIKNCLEANRLKVEGIYFGGHVSSLFKTSALPIQTNLALSVKQRIENGASMLTFFGHSSSTKYDIALDDPETYTNTGKYFLLIANGCYSGKFNTWTISTGEQFTKIANRGAIGFMASSSEGYLGELAIFTNTFYDVMYVDTAFKKASYADILKETNRRYGISSPSRVNHVRQINFQGDPAVKRHLPNKPDYEVLSNGIYFTPANFGALDNSVTINVIIRNNGLATRDSFFVDIERTAPNGTTALLKRIKSGPIPFMDTLHIEIVTKDAEKAGENRFCAIADPNNIISESNELNNRNCIDKFIPNNNVFILFPPRFSIVNQVMRPDSLVAGALDYENRGLRYLFEIDTVPFKPSIIHSGGSYLVSPPIPGNRYRGVWNVDLMPIIGNRDSVVFFWRVKLDLPNSDWVESSFIYIKNSPGGWAQAKPSQFYKGTGYRVDIDETTDLWSFVPNYALLKISTGGASAGIMGTYDMNGVTELAGNVCHNTVNLIVIDPVTLKARRHLGPMGCVYFNDPMLVFDVSSTLGQNQLADYIQNNIPNGHFVVAFNNFYTDPKSWNANLINAFESIGSANISNIEPGAPWVISGRKGAAIGTAEEYTYNASDTTHYTRQKLYVTLPIKSYWYEGTHTSETFGPSSTWQDLHWQHHDLDAGDKCPVSVWGIKKDGTAVKLIDKSFAKSNTNLSSLIDANLYPRIRLMAEMSDSLNRTAPQLDKWIVSAGPVPEGTLDPTFYELTPKNAELDEGDELKVKIGFRNISNYSFAKPIKVHIKILTSNNALKLIDSLYLPALTKEGTPTDTATFQYVFNTGNYPGKNVLYIDVNPNDDQLELYHFNNVLAIPFYAKPDTKNPIVDVTFDGHYISNGDIVSPTPEIKITLTDENKYFLMQNDSLFILQLSYYKNVFDTTIILYYNAVVNRRPSEVTFYPAKSAKPNQATVICLPKRLQDGRYRLSIFAQDRKQNISGLPDATNIDKNGWYNIDFEVVSKTSITNVLNYPNPFSTSTRFVFNLTGEQIPDVFKIQIYTVTGKLVKEIDLKAMGEVKLGKNITQYAWDGTDEFGDKLANGVYFYKVNAKINGKPIEVREDKTSQYFKNGIGKMYIMR
ncbi:MAG: C25 family cysteine peptidase [Bacteroidia bacterium]|nr:C25 family cysteine peptidase [Bacteroidia bacterium]